MTSKALSETDEILHTPDYVSERYEISPRTLQNWRLRGGGPRFVRLSHRLVRYPQSGLDEFEAERTFTSTSAATVAGE